MNQRTKIRDVTAIGVAVVAFGLSSRLMLTYFRDRVDDVLLYAASILVAAAAFFLSLFVSRLLAGRPLIQEKSLQKTPAVILLHVLVAAWTLLWVGMYLRTRTTEGYPADRYFWEAWSGLCRIGTIAVLLFALWLLQRRIGILNVKAFRGSRLCFIVLIVLAALFCTFTTWWPTSLCSDYSIYHCDAYFNSIYNAYYGEPLSRMNFGTYGHYALLLAPVFKLFGLAALPEVMAVMAGLCALCWFYVIDHMIDNPWIKIMTLIATCLLCALNYPDMVYYQTMPHRHILLAVCCALFVFGVKHKKNNHLGFQALLFAAAALAICWNTEIGLACMAATVLYCLLPRLDTAVTRKKLFAAVIGYAAAGIASFLLAWGLVSLWNVLNGGAPLSLRLFMVPLLPMDGKGSFVIKLSLPLQSGNSLWVHVTILMLFFVAFGVLKTRLFRGSGLTGRQLVAACIGFLGVGGMLFFINRSVFGNMYLVFYVVCALVGILLQWATDWCRRYPRDNVLFVFARTIKIMTGSLLFLLCMAALVSAGSYQRHRLETAIRQQKAEADFLQSIRQTVPENTLALGNGVSYLYAKLGWENPAKYFDEPASELTYDALHYYETVSDTLDTPVLIHMAGVFRFFPDKIDTFYSRFEIIETFTIADMEWCYAVPRTEASAATESAARFA